MYIKGMKIDNHIWNRNTAIITLQDANDREIREIYDMYLKGSDVTLAKTAIPFNHMFPPVTIDLKTTATGRHSDGDTGCITTYYKDMVNAVNRYKENVTMTNLKVEKVILNEPATIVFWNDNSKTVAVCSKDDKYDAEKGFYICCAKKLFGNDFKAGGKINKALEKAIVHNGNSVPQKEAENETD